MSANAAAALMSTARASATRCTKSWNSRLTRSASNEATGAARPIVLTPTNRLPVARRLSSSGQIPWHLLRFLVTSQRRLLFEDGIMTWAAKCLD